MEYQPEDGIGAHNEIWVGLRQEMAVKVQEKVKETLAKVG